MYLGRRPGGSTTIFTLKTLRELSLVLISVYQRYLCISYEIFVLKKKKKKATTKWASRTLAQHKLLTFWGIAPLVGIVGSYTQQCSSQLNNDHLSGHVQYRFWSSEPKLNGTSCSLARRWQTLLCFQLIPSKWFLSVLGNEPFTSVLFWLSPTICYIFMLNLTLVHGDDTWRLVSTTWNHI